MLISNSDKGRTQITPLTSDHESSETQDTSSKLQEDNTVITSIETDNEEPGNNLVPGNVEVQGTQYDFVVEYLLYEDNPTTPEPASHVDHFVRTSLSKLK